MTSPKFLGGRTYLNHSPKWQFYETWIIKAFYMVHIFLKAAFSNGEICEHFK